MRSQNLLGKSLLTRVSFILFYLLLLYVCYIGLYSIPVQYTTEEGCWIASETFGLYVTLVQKCQPALKCPNQTLIKH